MARQALQRGVVQAIGWTSAQRTLAGGEGDHRESSMRGLAHSASLSPAGSYRPLRKLAQEEFEIVLGVLCDENTQ
jgi:hypothetical protein